MVKYDRATNTFTWDAGSEEVIQFKKHNVGTVTSPTTALYKLGNESNIAGTYITGSSAVTNDGTTIIFTTGKFTSTLPSATYKLIFAGTLNGNSTYIHEAKLVVRKKSVI